ncbi:MAG: putative peptidase, partial [Crocinitomix sp.]
MKIQLTFFIFSLSLLANSQTYPNVEIKAAAFSEALVSEDYETAVDYFTPEVLAQVDAAKLEEIWNQVQGQAGTYESKSAVHVSKENDAVVSYQALTFANTLLDLKLAFDASESVAGILFIPHKVLNLDLVETEKIFEEEILVKTGKDVQLRGILTLPKGDDKVPAIILVHGSGPNDMDETLGPNKLFKDIAHGLAEKGIAVIRYTKRTKEYSAPPQIDITYMTLFEETIEDAISAVDLAKKDKRIDKKQIYVLGHSLGGMAAPRIGTLAKNTKGIIIMAGNARPMEELIYEQYKYLVEEDGIVTPEEESIVVNFEGQLKVLEKFRKEGKTDWILPMG